MYFYYKECFDLDLLRRHFISVVFFHSDFCNAFFILLIQSGPVVRFAEPAPSNPQMALRLLEFLMHQTACRTILLENCRPNLWRITDCLLKTQVCILTVYDEKCYLVIYLQLLQELVVAAFQRCLCSILLLRAAIVIASS